MIRNYEDLTVYQRSYRAALEMYKITEQMPREELHGIISQIRRAGLSIPLNIAEGYGKRDNVAEFKRFLRMAKGSCDEMKVLIDFSFDLKYITEGQKETMKSEYDEIGKMLHGLIMKWE